MNCVRWLLLGATITLLAACGSDNDGNGETPAPTATATASTTAIPGHEPGTSTGVPEVDAIVEALQSQDWGRIEPLIYVQEKECVEKAEQIGALECPAGTAPGTPLRAVSFGGSEGFWVLEDELQERALEVVPDGSLLYAVLRTLQGAGIESDFVVVFATAGPSRDVPVCAPAIHVNDGRIVHLGYGCPQSPAQRIAQVGSAGPVDFLLPPP